MSAKVGAHGRAQRIGSPALRLVLGSGWSARLQVSAEQTDNHGVDIPHDQLPNDPRLPLDGTFPDYTLRPTAARQRAAPVEEAGLLAASTLALRPGWANRAPAPRSSIYARAAGVLPGEVRAPVDTESLSRRFRGLEPAVRLPTTSLLLVLLPDNGPPPAGQLRMARDVAQLGARVVVLGPTTLPRSLPHDPREPATVPRRPDDPLTDEWCMLSFSAAGRVAVLAKRVGDTRTWSWLQTRDDLAIHRAGTGILDRIPFLHLRLPPIEQQVIDRVL